MSVMLRFTYYVSKLCQSCYVSFNYYVLIMCLVKKNYGNCKKNPACLNDLVNSRQPANTRKDSTSSTQKSKGHKISRKGMPISFSQKLKEATKPSNKEINSVSVDDECAELESEYTQVCKIINNANDLAESNNSRRQSNWKSLSKIYYQILNLVRF